MSGWYRRLWRWHFYAGLIALPFVALLSVTGMIYLFKPALDHWSERGYDHLALTAPARSLDDQVAAALAAVPGARLKALEWRADRADAARVLLIDADGTPLRVLVRPDTLEILSAAPEGDRISEFVKRIHGELLSGEAGAMLVETAGGWGIVLFLTGLYLWWPRNAGLGGVLYPRRGRLVRDLHAVTGFWISALALFFLLSALPWTKVWGGAFKQIEASAAAAPSRDWTTGPASEHAEHLHQRAEAAIAAPGGFDRVAALVPSLNLAAPVLIAPPGAHRPDWTVSSDSQNRTARDNVAIDPAGQVVRRAGFAAKPLLERIVGVAISAHEGHLFGWVNQALGLLTGLGLLTMSVSAALMWWKRRPGGVLGAPPAAGAPRVGPGLGALVIGLGIALPMMGVSLVLVLILERLVLSRIAPARRFLGLEG
jgi:uncharacterized iron-regulated membrane protein